MQSYDWRATKEVEVADLHSNFTHIIIFTCSALSVHVLQNEFNGFYGRKIEMQMQFSTVKHHLKNNGRSGFFAPGYKGFSPLKLPFTWRMFTWLTWKRERILMMRMRGWNLWQEILTYKVSTVSTHFLPDFKVKLECITIFLSHTTGITRALNSVQSLRQGESKEG